MHLRFNFDACPMHSPSGFVHLTHQNLSASALFCLNSLAKVTTQLLMYKHGVEGISQTCYTTPVMASSAMELQLGYLGPLPTKRMGGRTQINCTNDYMIDQLQQVTPNWFFISHFILFVRMHIAIYIHYKNYKNIEDTISEHTCKSKLGWWTPGNIPIHLWLSTRDRKDD